MAPILRRPFAKVLSLKLIFVFFGVVALDILTIGYLFNRIL